ncbi:hypothetical protein HGM15179_012120 [Zosterops borbonicus]|uniref:Uncharacterized protein n=1 Tax=Zosterops borbonicus TaxID=364589 RepID=A0A8K1GAE1_9PASS|nr:hypothetical protein HGM15179_012120 [Zosterops borbonicus]
MHNPSSKSETSSSTSGSCDVPLRILLHDPQSTFSMMIPFRPPPRNSPAHPLFYVILIVVTHWGQAVLELMGKIMLEVLAKDWKLVPAPVLWHHAELDHQAWEGISDPPEQPHEP